MKSRWKSAVVDKIEHISQDINAYYLKIPETAEFDFTPGQFITLDLPLGEKRLERWRSYSIANLPGQYGKIELCIGRIKGGNASEWFFNEVKVGDQIDYKGPEGSFLLPEANGQNLVMICTGTGVAPFKSMIEDIYASGKNYASVHLILGTRYYDNIPYKELWKEISDKNKNFSVDFALSRENRERFHHGYVHDLYFNKYQGNDHNDIQFLLCGWTEMIDEAVKRLTLEMRVDKSNIFYELYG